MNEETEAALMKAGHQIESLQTKLATANARIKMLDVALYSLLNVADYETRKKIIYSTRKDMGVQDG